MSFSEGTCQPLSPEQTRFLEETAVQALGVLEEFTDDHIAYGPTALQLLDEWIVRLERKGPVSTASRAQIIAFIGKTFLHAHGGYWATHMQGGRQHLGVLCPVVGPGEQVRFIDIIAQVNRRLHEGIGASLALAYLTASVDLKGRF
jgi:hypothetical protein